MAADGDAPPTKQRKSSSSLPKETDDKTKVLIKEKLLVDMPRDFYQFWTFLWEMNSDDPQAVLQPFDLRLGGPFDVLLGKSSETDEDYLLHHRFYYDIPEFQTVLLSNKKDSKYHIGYYRDGPSEEPVFLASNDADKGCKLTILGDNLFAILHNHLSGAQYSGKSTAKQLSKKIEQFMADNSYEFGRRTEKIRTREKKIVSKGFHGAGIVVPVDQNEVGWREVPRTIGELKKLFTSIAKGDKNKSKSEDELQELITYIQFANDEGDCGQGLELANDLFCYGDENLDGYVKALMPMAYCLLGYSAFEKIILTHLAKRSSDSNSYLV